MPVISRQPFTLDRVVRLLLTIGGLVFAIWLIYRLRSALLPFGVACLIAYMMEPFVRFNTQLLHLRSRVVPILVTLFETLVFFLILCYFCIPSIIDEMHVMASLLQRYSESSGEAIPFLPPEIHDALHENLDIKQIAQWLTDQNLQGIINYTLQLVSGGVGIVFKFLSWAIIFLYVAFILLDYERLMRRFRDLIPPKYRPQVQKISSDIKDSMNHYFRGQALIAAIVAAIYSIGFLIVGLPLAVIMGLFIGVLFMVPYLQFVSIIPVTLLCVVVSIDSTVDFWTIWWGCIAVYAVVQIVADVILTPKIMGKAMGLNPAIILLSLSIWGSLLGILGMLIALPLTTLLISYYDTYVIRPSEATENGSEQNGARHSDKQHNIL
ncbi:MAG: AI-2E family transporter [Muribaculaceae bacterium]|nr:AI-2E family transporter [Muribaculaceae bacterium]